tara:strand:- start:1128 stop:1355 length:228 start_codon:yes stop_codon:yes gene_type:complete
MIHFNGSKLREKMKSSGIKMNFIADKIGLHRVTLAYYCMGKIVPKKETLKEIAKLCRCKIGDFYDSKEEVEKREH